MKVSEWSSHNSILLQIWQLNFQLTARSRDYFLFDISGGRKRTRSLGIQGWPFILRLMKTLFILTTPIYPQVGFVSVPNDFNLKSVVWYILDQMKLFFFFWFQNDVLIVANYIMHR